MAIYGTESGETLDRADGVTDNGDQIYGFGGEDWIYGLGGNDWLKGGGGADHLFGGEGSDTASYYDSTAGVQVDLQWGTGRGGTAEGDTLNGIENVSGSLYHDHIRGNDLPNTLDGLDGQDQLFGYGGRDILNGGDGDDLLTGGPGADTLNGGDANDTVTYYYGSSTAVFVSLVTMRGFNGDAE